MDILYPPVFYQSVIPAFVNTNSCKIYFGLSAYNSLTDIEDVLITIENQKTNKSAFSSTDAPIGIYNVGKIIEDTTKSTEDRFYVNLPSKTSFDINTYYKVQLRFVKKGKTGLANPINETSIQTNIANLSEWSTVVLLRRISSPKIIISKFDDNNASNVINFTTKDIVIQGTMSFEGKEQERMKFYSIQLYKSANKDNILEDSGNIQVDPFKKVSEIFYRFRYNFQTNIEYTFKLSYITQELFSNYKIYKFKIDEVLSQDLFLTGVEISSIKDEQSGRIGIRIYKPQNQLRQNNFVIKRTDYRSNFKIWEQVYYYSTPLLQPIDFTWFDKTVECGVYYLYGVERVMENGETRSQLLQLQNPVRLDFKNILLSTKTQQLKIKYDAEISNIAYNIQENQVNTIGSKYPIVTRNSNIKYRTLSISGLITYFMDIRENTMGLSKKELYGEQENLYKEDNQIRNITPYNDYIHEKNFRQKVIEFLEENNIKLLRTFQQGNLLVKLMNISVTPMTEVKGYLYSFSCTAVEIDDFNFENLKKYDLIDYGAFIKYSNPTKDFLIAYNAPNQNVYRYDNNDKVYIVNSGLKNFIIKQNLLNHIWVKTALRDLYVENEIGEEVRNNLKIKYLNHLRIEFSNPPYPIYKDGQSLIGNITPLEDNEKEIVATGHIIEINNIETLVGKNGIFELSGKDVQITKLRFLTEGQQGSVIMQGIVEIIPKKINFPNSYHSFRKIGQLWGSFSFQENLVMDIFNKYDQDFAKSEISENNVKRTVSTKVQRVNGMRFYGKPGTIIYVKELQDDNLERHVIGQGEILEFFEENTVIQEAYFYGMHFQEAPQGTETPYPYQYIETGISKNSFAAIENPIINGIYTVNNSKYIYYNNNWYGISENYDIILSSIQGVVDYFCTILQEEYIEKDES